MSLTLRCGEYSFPINKDSSAIPLLYEFDQIFFKGKIDNSSERDLFKGCKTISLTRIFNFCVKNWDNKDPLSQINKQLAINTVARKGFYKSVELKMKIVFFKKFKKQESPELENFISSVEKQFQVTRLSKDAKKYEYLIKIIKKTHLLLPLFDAYKKAVESKESEEKRAALASLAQKKISTVNESTKVSEAVSLNFSNSEIPEAEVPDSWEDIFKDEEGNIL